MYQDIWRNSLIPLCTDRPTIAPHLCSEFRPSLSNHGMCITKNQAPAHEIFRPTEYMKMFTDVFFRDRDNFNISKNIGSGMRYKTAFLINANQFMDMKNGLKWNERTHAEFRLAIHAHYDMPEIRDSSIKIFSGFKTIIRVNAIELESEPSVQELNLKRRGCKFPSESEGMTIFKTYSRYILRFG